MVETWVARRCQLGALAPNHANSANHLAWLGKRHKYLITAILERGLRPTTPTQKVPHQARHFRFRHPKRKAWPRPFLLNRASPDVWRKCCKPLDNRGIRNRRSLGCARPSLVGRQSSSTLGQGWKLHAHTGISWACECCLRGADDDARRPGS